MTEKSQQAISGSDELKQLAEEQHRLAQIGRIVSSSLDIADVYPRFAEHALELVRADCVVIALFSEDETQLIEQHVAGMRFPSDTEPGTRHPINDEIYTRLIVDRVPIVYSGTDYKGYARSSAVEDSRRDSGLKALMVIPLVWQGNSYGVVSFRALDPDAFGDHQLDLAQQIASQIAGAIITARQYSELENESHEREQLAEIQRVAGSSLNIEDIFEDFVERARLLVPADRLVLTIIDKNSTIIGRHEFGVNFRGPDSPRLSPEIRDILHDLGDSQKSYFVANAEEYENTLVRLPEEVARYAAGLRSMLSLPLVWRGDLVGILTFRSKDPNAYQTR